MTQQYGEHTSPVSQRSTPEVARDEAADVARMAADKGGEVAGTVGEQAGRVASEAAEQARNLLHEGRQQLTGQAQQGQQRAADGLHTLADQLRQMSEKADDQGVVTEAVRQVAERTHNVASWLEQREPGDLLDEVRQFARRKPGLFLAGAALAGVAVGRLTRGAIAAQSSNDESGSSHTAQDRIPRQPSAPPAPRYGAGPSYPTAAANVPDYPTTPMPPAPPVWEQQSRPVNR